MAGVTGHRTRPAVPAENAELHDQVAEILNNQLRFTYHMARISTALTAWRAEQDSSRGGWMAAIHEARREIEEASRGLDAINATLSRLLGAVETLVSLRYRQPGSRPARICPDTCFDTVGQTLGRNWMSG